MLMVYQTFYLYPIICLALCAIDFIRKKKRFICFDKSMCHHHVEPCTCHNIKQSLQLAQWYYDLENGCFIIFDNLKLNQSACYKHPHLRDGCFFGFDGRRSRDTPSSLPHPAMFGPPPHRIKRQRVHRNKGGIAQESPFWSVSSDALRSLGRPDCRHVPAARLSSPTSSVSWLRLGFRCKVYTCQYFQ